MKNTTGARLAGAYVLLLATCLGAAACDSEDLKGRSQIVETEPAVVVHDDVNIDPEPVRAAPADDDDPRSPDLPVLDSVDVDIVGLRWSDASTASIAAPAAESGEWMLEVRAHVGSDRVRWVQGPYDVDEVEGQALALEPPEEAFERLPNAPALVMARLVLIDGEGRRTGALALPDLVMQRTRTQGVHFVLQTDLQPRVERDGDDVSMSTDLPKTL